MRREVSMAASGLAMLAKVGVVAAVIVVVEGFLTAEPAPAVHQPHPVGRALALHTARATHVEGAPRPSPPSVADRSQSSTVAGPARAVTPTTTSPEPAPASTPPPLPGPQASATASAPDPGPGCQAALAYLAAHAAPGFQVACPAWADGHQATTICDDAPECIPGTAWIWIADPCPAAYMNEASNSWVLIGESAAPWDPFGYCGQPGNPYG